MKLLQDLLCSLGLHGFSLWQEDGKTAVYGHDFKGNLEELPKYHIHHQKRRCEFCGLVQRKKDSDQL